MITLDKNAVDHDKVEAMRKLVDSPTSAISGMEFNTFLGRLGSLDQGQLSVLSRKLAGLVPSAPSELSELNLERELVSQFHLVKDLQDTVLHDEEIPLNQRSQLAGQVASTLQQLIKMQVDLARDEQLKRIEAALLDAIAGLPDETKTAFFAQYEKIAAERGAQK